MFHHNPSDVGFTKMMFTPAQIEIKPNKPSYLEDSFWGTPNLVKKCDLGSCLLGVLLLSLGKCAWQPVNVRDIQYGPHATMIILG